MPDVQFAMAADLYYHRQKNLGAAVSAQVTGD
jgi:hypothetical protein